MIAGPMLADGVFHRFLIAFVLISPFGYMYWQGNAHVELVDTTQTDKMAKFFYLCGAAVALTAYFINSPASPWKPANPAKWKCVEVPIIGSE